MPALMSGWIPRSSALTMSPGGNVRSEARSDAVMAGFRIVQGWRIGARHDRSLSLDERQLLAQQGAKRVAQGERQPRPDALRKSAALFQALKPDIADAHPGRRIEVIRRFPVMAPPLGLEQSNIAVRRAAPHVEKRNSAAAGIANDVPVQEIVGKLDIVERAHDRIIVGPPTGIDDAQHSADQGAAMADELKPQPVAPQPVGQAPAGAPAHA